MNNDKIVGYVAGYGSLIDANSRKSTIGETKAKIIIAKIRGLRRTWLAHERNNPNWRKFWIIKGTTQQIMPVFKPCYLDLTVDEKSELIAGLIPVTKEQIEALDERENGYVRVNVTNLVKDWKIELPVYTYYGRATCKIGILDKEAHIPIPYEVLCAKAAKEMSKEMGENFIEHMNQCTNIKRIDVKLGDNITY